MPIVDLRTDPSRMQALELQMLQQGLMNAGGAAATWKGQQDADLKRKAFGQLLSGRKAQMDPGIAALDIGKTQGGAPFTPSLPGMLQPGQQLTPQMAEAFMLQGGDPAQLMSMMPKPVDPMEQARLDLSRQGLELDREGMGLRREQFSSGLELDRQGMGLRREQFASDQAFQNAQLDLKRQELAQSGQAGAPKMSDVRNARLDYADVSAPWNATVDAYEKVNSALKRGTAAGDMAGIFSFMKSLDPGSTVREGEYASASNTTGIPGWVMNQYNRAVDGTILSPQQRQEFMAVSGDFLTQQRDRQLQLEAQHSEQASLAGLDPARVVPDVFGKYREFTPDVPPRAGEGVSSVEEIPGDLMSRGKAALSSAGEVVGGMFGGGPEQPPAGGPAMSGATPAPAPGMGGPPVVQDQASYDALPPGSKYTTGDGVTRTKGVR